jgi:hypothetical protein
MADQLGQDVIMNGGQTKRRNARQRVPVIAESEPLELGASAAGTPSGVRPALALTAAEEVETIIAMTYANEARAVLDDGDEALHAMIRTWDAAERETLARALAEFA